MFYYRRLLEALRSGTSRNKVRLLFGARQTGKTELLRHALPPEETWRVDLTVTRDRRRYEADPDAFRREVRALDRRIVHLVIDEIQKVPALLDEVQSLYDEDHTRFQFYLTGSSARRLRRHSANLLPGRCHTFRLLPICRWESEGPARWTWAGAEPPKGQLPAGDRLRFPDQSLERTLLFGTLPGVRQEPAATAAATLSAYVENYLEEEVRREALVRDLGSFGVFVKLSAIESGRAVNLASLSRQSGVAASTLKSYYEILADTFAGSWIRSYRRPGRRRLLTTPRFYYFDNGVRNAAAGFPMDPSLLASEGPHMFEHWIGLELAYRAVYLGRGHEVSYWRTVSGAEVDFVWESPTEDIPIEVKWTERPTTSDARHVESFLETYPRRSRRGLVVCRCPVPQRLTDRVTALPWNAL